MKSTAATISPAPSTCQPGRMPASKSQICGRMRRQRRVEHQRDAEHLADQRPGRNNDRHGQQRERRELRLALPPAENPIGHQPGEDRSSESRHADVGLGLLEIMDQREQRDHVDQLMQAPPAHAAEPAHHGVGRGRRQHRKSDPGEGADDEIDALGDLGEELDEAVALVGEEQRQMRGDVDERRHADHAPHVDQWPITQDAAQRRDGERKPEKHQRPEAGAMDQLIERARAVGNRVCFDQRFGGRQQQNDEGDDAQPRDPAAPVEPHLPRLLAVFRHLCGT